MSGGRLLPFVANSEEDESRIQPEAEVRLKKTAAMRLVVDGRGGGSTILVPMNRREKAGWKNYPSKV